MDNTAALSWYFTGSCESVCRDLNRFLVAFGAELFLPDGARPDDIAAIQVRATGRNRTEILIDLLTEIAAKTSEIEKLRRSFHGKDALVYRLIDHLQFLRDRIDDDSGMDQIDRLLSVHDKRDVIAGPEVIKAPVGGA